MRIRENILCNSFFCQVLLIQLLLMHMEIILMTYARRVIVLIAVYLCTGRLSGSGLCGHLSSFTKKILLDCHQSNVLLAHTIFVFF